MKNLFYLLIISMTFLSCNQTTSVATEEEKGDVKTYTANATIEIPVSGMTCEGCENSVETALCKIEGVTAVEASHTKATTIISYDSTMVDTELLAKTINKLGYQALDVEPVSK